MESVLLKALEKRFNFNALLVDGQDKWGMLVNNQWTGMIGDVIDEVSKRTCVKIVIIVYKYSSGLKWQCVASP